MYSLQLKNIVVNGTIIIHYVIVVAGQCWECDTMMSLDMLERSGNVKSKCFECKPDQDINENLLSKLKNFHANIIGR